MTHPEEGRQDAKRVETPKHLAPQTVKCSSCGVVYFVGAMHMCGNTITRTKTYADGLREAAEIARAQQREHAKRLHNAFIEQSADRAMRYAYREDAVRDVVEAIEAKLTALDGEGE